MYRTVLACGFAALVTALLPLRGEAALIEQCETGAAPCGVIGTFSWDETFNENGDFTGHLFTLINSADTGDSPFAALDPGELGFTLVTLSVDGFEYFLFDAPAGSLTDTLGLPFFDPIGAASITFSFLGTPFFVPLPAGSSFASPQAIDVYAQSVAVPEPATLLLLGIGVGTARLLRKREHGPRS